MTLEISSPFAGAFWLVAGVGLTYWYRGRRNAADRRLSGEAGPKPSADEAQTIKVGLVREAFLAGGAWLLLYVLLAALF